MFYGTIIFKFFGTLVRWAFAGFKGSFRDIWDGTKHIDNEGNFFYALQTNILGFIVISVLCILIMPIKCN
jgi:hypothetical protein